MNDFFAQKRKNELVVQLGQALDRAIDEFAEENEALIRQACEVGDEVERVRTPAVLAFLGHCLWRIYDARGRTEALALSVKILDQFAQNVPSRSTSEVAPPGELDG